MSYVNNSGAFIIYPQMIDAFLKGNELVIFAYLYNKCQDSEDKTYKEGIAAICRHFKLTQRTVISVVNKLIKRGLLEKDYYINGYNNRIVKLKVKGI